MINCRVDTSEIIANLIREKLRLKKIINQKDLLISELKKKLNDYEEVNFKCQKTK